MLEKEPLISVGIPCYNRPEGLRRTLECITGQTYKNLEIIVSDNCSPNPDVERVVREFASRDIRIQYYRQGVNKGLMPNFQFVLEKATGEYFMWAADDDEWLSDFIEMNIKYIGDSGSCFTDYIRRNRFNNQELRRDLPSISPEKSTYANAFLYIKNLVPSMIYGIHRTNTIRWVIKSDAFFDFWDCFFCLRQIVEHGFNVVHSPLYVAGIDAEEYIKKPFDPKRGKIFTYTPFFKNSFKCIITSKKIKPIQKLSLIYILIIKTLSLFANYEKDEQHFKALLVNKFIKRIELTHFYITVVSKRLLQKPWTTLKDLRS